MFSHWNRLSKKLKLYIFNKNATLTPNSCDFYDLRNYVAKFCCQNVRTFSADFFGLKTEFRRRYPFMDVWTDGRGLETDWRGWPTCRRTRSSPRIVASKFSEVLLALKTTSVSSGNLMPHTAREAKGSFCKASTRGAVRGPEIGFTRPIVRRVNRQILSLEKSFMSPSMYMRSLTLFLADLNISMNNKKKWNSVLIDLLRNYQTGWASCVSSCQC